MMMFFLYCVKPCSTGKPRDGCFHQIAALNKHILWCICGSSFRAIDVVSHGFGIHTHTHTHTHIYMCMHIHTHTHRFTPCILKSSILISFLCLITLVLLGYYDLTCLLLNKGISYTKIFFFFFWKYKSKMHQLPDSCIGLSFNI